MANQQPPPRPWFRLAALIRPPPPAPTRPPPPPAATPRPPLVRFPAPQPFRPPSPPPPPSPAAMSPPPSRSPPPPIATIEQKDIVAETSRSSPIYSPALSRSFSATSVTTLPVLSDSSLPSSPTPKEFTSPPPRSPPPPPSPSPVPPPAPPTPVTTGHASIPSPAKSPKIMKPLPEIPPQMSNPKPMSHPPPPLFLPTAEINPENEERPELAADSDQKTLFLQTANGKKSKASVNYMQVNPNENYNKNSKMPERDLSKHVECEKKSPSSDVYGIRQLVTLAGNNKGAIMEIRPWRHEKRSSKAGKIEQKNESKSSAEGTSKTRNQNQKARTAAFMNSNVQGINNSILYNCSYAGHDPGIHISLSGDPIHLRENNPAAAYQSAAFP